VPIRVSDEGHLPHLGRNEREMLLRETGDVYPNVQRPCRPQLSQYAAGHDVEGLEADQNAGECPPGRRQRKRATPLALVPRSWKRFLITISPGSSEQEPRLSAKAGRLMSSIWWTREAMTAK
jgi:hypothetical protein